MSQPESSPPHPFSPGPPLWVLLLKKRKLLLFVAFTTMVSTALVTLFLPKRYEAAATLLIIPPKYAGELKLPPRTLDMTTAKALATSLSVVQETIHRLRSQKALLSLIQHSASSTEESLSHRISRNGNPLSATEAALSLNSDLTEDFLKAWEDLPPPDLLSGYRDFDKNFFERTDPQEVSESLTASIYISEQTNIDTRYQPLLRLSAVWRSPQSAGLLAHVWGRTLLRTVESDYVEPTLRAQKQRLLKLSEIENAIAAAIEKEMRTRAEAGMDLKRRELEAIREELHGGFSERDSLEDRLNQLDLKIRISSSGENRGPGPREVERKRDALMALRESFEERAATLNREIVDAESLIAQTVQDRKILETEYDYLLSEGGGIEALTENYPRLVQARLLEAPMPPRHKVWPSRTLIVLASGVIAFLILCAWIQFADLLRREKDSFNRHRSLDSRSPL